MNRPDTNTEQAIALMLDFAWRTGLNSDRPPRRYLWTDAFAACNFLGLGRATGEHRFTQLALDLLRQVHDVLGRHRADDPRNGWLSGLSEGEGRQHPTCGGLRIGKALPERGADEPFDEQLEWDRDGQYFHYLTKWMHALDQITRATAEPRYNAWARELARRAHDAFTYLPAAGGTPRMYWKMSIDLTRPLVPSMGQHDPLEGYVTFLQLRTTAAELSQPAAGADLAPATRRFALMSAASDLASPDPLGIGGLLADAWRLHQLAARGADIDGSLLERMLDAALMGLEYYAGSGQLQATPDYRLAFRELGLAIGLHAVRRMEQALAPDAAGPGLQAPPAALMTYTTLGDAIESFWRDPANRRGATWSGQRDINEVMLATCLAPEGFLVLSEIPAVQ